MCRYNFNPKPKDEPYVCECGDCFEKRTKPKTPPEIEGIRKVFVEGYDFGKSKTQGKFRTFEIGFNEGWDKGKAEGRKEALVEVEKIRKFDKKGDHISQWYWSISYQDWEKLKKKLGGESRAFSTEDAVDKGKNLGNNEKGGDKT